MPARVGDTRTPAEKESDARKAVYNLLTEQFQSWGSLRRAAKRQGVSTATLAKHLKKFVETGISIKKEKEVKGARLPRTFYRLTSTKPILGERTERELYRLLKETPSLEFTEEEEHAWSHMETALKIFSYSLASLLHRACEVGNPEKAKKYVEYMLDIRLKDEIRDLVKIFYKYRDIKNENIPISSLVEESFMIKAEESAESWLPESLMKEFAHYLPTPKIMIAWITLTSKSREEVLKRIQEEIRYAQSQLSNSR